MNNAHDAVEAYYAERNRKRKQNGKRDAKRKPKVNVDRQRQVKALRKMPYSEYMTSPHWKRKRQQALRHHGRRCNRCGCRKNLQVHHKTYRRRGHERMSDLEILCRDCHAGEHQHEKPWIVDSLTVEFVELFGT